jgi:hypothetical protein
VKGYCDGHVVRDADEYDPLRIGSNSSADLSECESLWRRDIIGPAFAKPPGNEQSQHESYSRTRWRGDQEYV